MKKFSILMALHNSDDETHLDECLLSLNKQTLKSSETIVVTDGLIDSRLHNVIDSFQRDLNIQLHLYQGSEKLPGALNYGLEKCKYNIVARMDPDDVCTFDRFEQQIPFFLEHKLSILGSDIDEFLDDPLNPIRSRHTQVTATSPNYFLYNPLNHMTVIYDRNAVQAVGGYDYLKGFEDWHLWLKILNKGHLIKNIPSALVMARIGNGFLNRRSGLRYAFHELKAYLRFNKEKLMPMKYVFIGIFFRVPGRLFPTRAQETIYKMIRKNKPCIQTYKND